MAAEQVVAWFAVDDLEHEQKLVDTLLLGPGAPITGVFAVLGKVGKVVSAGGILAGAKPSHLDNSLRLMPGTTH
jgi:hypothetical protein